MFITLRINSVLDRRVIGKSTAHFHSVFFQIIGRKTNGTNYLIIYICNAP